MARKKNYKEEEVIEKATELFWRNGYKNTSMRSLEEAMGINKFSIYSSFGSKKGVFLESLKCYKSKYRDIVIKLKSSNKGKESIKEFFYDFLEFSGDYESGKGCLMTSTAGELGAGGDMEIMYEITSFTKIIKDIFKGKLALDECKDGALIEKQANFLIIVKQGLSNASKVFDKKSLEDFIETSFDHI